MKKRVLMVLTTLSLFVALAGVSAFAQSDMRLRANIPFEFSVGHKMLPAGEYRVWKTSEGALAIRREDCRVSQVFIVNQAQTGATPTESKLIFNRYGDQYFLSQIWTAGNDYGYQLNKNKAERELVRASRALARNGSDPQIVTLIAHR
ncbi:MAG TPA: hypothetical protein VFV34_11285 [Blastocatellia bacterium]|nr:hypothetical protein [Blastocatellia bacterium]